MSNWDGSFISEHPSIMAGPGEVPSLAGGAVRQHRTTLSMLPWLLQQQQDRYGNDQQPPVAVQHTAYEGPPLRFLLDGRRVKFCYTKEEVIHQYKTLPEESGHTYHPVPEYAAVVQGPAGSGVVRARINTTGHAPSSIMSTVADKLGLPRHPLSGPGMVQSVPMNGQVTPLDVLDDPLTIQLLAGPDNVAMEITLATVLVVPTHLPTDTNVMFELQLGMFDFVRQVRHDWLPLWASQFEDRESGFRCAVPVIAPLPPRVGARVSGVSSTFHITQESYDEVLELQMTRQRVRARRAAAAAAVAGNSDAPAPAEAAAGAMQQAVQVGPPSTAMLGAAATQAPAAGTQAWVDEWAPAPNRQQQGREGGRRGGRGRGRGRGRSRGRQHGGADTATAMGAANAAAGEAVNAAQSVTGQYANLDPLSKGLVACSWVEVSATALPEGDDICAICLESMSEDSTRLVTQLRCRHTYCVMCLRDHNTARNFRRQQLTCPHCRQEV